LNLPVKRKEEETMKLRVIGVQRKSGTFKNPDTGKSYDYDNLNLHCVGSHMDVYGDCVREVKLKISNAAELVAAVGGKVENIIGHVVDFEFGSYSKVVNYELVEQMKPPPPKARCPPCP